MNTRRTPSEVSSWKKAALMAAMTVALAACGGGGGSSTPGGNTGNLSNNGGTSTPAEGGFAEALARLKTCKTASSGAPGIQACLVGTYKGKDLVNGTTCSVTIGADNEVKYTTLTRFGSFTTADAPSFYSKTSGVGDFPIFLMSLKGGQDELDVGTNFEHENGTITNRMIDFKIDQGALEGVSGPFAATCRLSEK